MTEHEPGHGSRPEGRESDEQWRGRLEHSLDANREETTRLTGSVQDLAGAIRMVQELRREQQQATEDAQTAAKEAEASNVAAGEKASQIGSRVARASWYVVACLSLLNLVASTVVLLALSQYVVDKLNEGRDDRLTACYTRNQATMSNVRREEALAKAHTDPRLSAIHRRSATELRLAVVDCAKTQRPVR